jgi:hypothetical protein
MALFDCRQTAGRQAGKAKMENRPVKINVALAGVRGYVPIQSLKAKGNYRAS